ncbi:MAG: hypothetical protein G01um101413_487 [Parcubacteria group bacterium Gr01-1014_13]|nr:MAG: hypothetical protein G01um101413_487 [Parcubacteria group bacterium Gr01-1014_13]
MNTDQEISQEPAENQKSQEKQAEAQAGPSFENLIKLSETPAYMQEILGKLDLSGLDFKSALEEINNIIVEELKKNPENIKDLERFKAAIERLYKGEVDKETEISPDTVGRAERDVELAQEVEKMETGQEFNRQQLAGVLERQNWGKIFTGLKKGDKVLSFLVPGADFLSIKNLNDVILGPQVTNKIIAEKRRVIEREIKKIDTNASILQSDYKIEVVKISKDSSIDTGKLEEVSLAIDKEMTVFIEKIVDDLMVEEVTDKDKIKILEEFKNDLQGKSEKTNGKGGFKMNYGLSEVGGDKMEDKLESLNHSQQTSRMARQNPDNYGAEYNEESIEAELGNIKELREKIISEHGNKITDNEGNEFEIFIKKGEKFFLNPDVLRDVRKGEFKTEDKNNLADIAFYVKKLNILDTVKPFTLKEISQVEDNINIARSLSEKIKKGEVLENREVELAADMLRSEEKDRAYTSKSEFNKRAVAMSECAYVSLDVLDLGVDQLLEYENILQDVDKVSGKKKMDKFNELALSAGDLTTEKLRDFRKKVAQVCKKFGFKDGLITGEVGGDELALAIDTSNMSEEKLDDFLFALKEKTNTRVIKTVVAKSEKSVSLESDQQELVESHLQALKRAEAGVAIAKDIEKAERKLNLLLKKQGEETVKQQIGPLRGLFVVENGKVKSNVVVVEKDGVFKIGKFKIANESKEESYDVLGYEFDYASISNELDSILGRETA